MGRAEAAVDGYSGYWADTPYIEFHNVGQEPWRIAMEVRRVGGAHPDPAAPFAYCDVGCGCGYTLLSLAAALPHGEFHGVDLVAEHIDGARRMAEAAGLSNVHFHLGAAETLPQGAIPPCDFVAAHGFFSWVTPAVAERILGFIAGLTKPDGLVFASVNLESGWAQMRPVRRHLLETHASASGSAAERLRAAIDSAWRTFGPGTQYAADNPMASAMIETWRNEPINYIPHELMNEAWRLFTIREAFEMFAAAGFSYAGARLSGETDVRDTYPGLIGRGDETEVEDSLSKARGERFRSLVFRPAAAATPPKSMIVPTDEVLGVTTPRAARDLYTPELVDSLGAGDRDLAARSVDGTGVSLGEVMRDAGREAKLKLFASINQLARTGEFATYRKSVAPATGPARIAAAHPLTPALLATRYAVAAVAHAPSPVFGGAVHLPGSVAAVLRAHLEGASDLAKSAENIYRDAVGDPEFWAVNDPETPRDIPDFAKVVGNYRKIWLPFLERMRVVVPV